MKKNTYILFIFLSLVCGYVFLLNSPKKNDIPKLTQEERLLFSKMWETLYFNANFGYTLLGSKPVSVQNWSKDPLKLSPSALYFFLDGRTKELWEQFSKNHPSEHYTLTFKEFTLPKTIDPDQEIHGEVMLINKMAVKNCFLQHKNLMTKTFFFHDLTPETIASEILSSDNHELTGLILGYGFHNSNYFHRDYDLRAYYKNAHYFPHKLELNQEDIDLLKETRDFTMINQINLDPKDIALELQQRRNTPFHVLQSYVKENPLSTVSLPCFRAEQDHSETLELIKKYQNEQKMIVQFGLSKPLLDSILHVYYFGASDE